MRSNGLHHLMVEVADNERNRMGGPDWFIRDGGFHAHQSSPWRLVLSSALPGVHPRYREIRIGEALDGIPECHIQRDGSGRPRAIFEPMRLRQSYVCGDMAALNGFRSVAKAASNILTELRELWETEVGEDFTDLFQSPRGGIRYVFGEVPDPPVVFLNRGWQGGGLVYPNGILIDLPIAECQPDEAHWLLLLHRLSWRRRPGSPLQGDRLAWHANMTVPYDWVSEKRFDSRIPGQWRDHFAQIPATSYYSVLGERERPLDVNLASVFAVDMLLSARPKAPAGPNTAATVLDYSKEAWNTPETPPLKASEKSALELSRELKPRFIVVTATRVERDTVLRQMAPTPETGGLVRTFHENNTYFLGALGKYKVALCMSAMGGSGRDSVQTVCGEAIRFWRPEGLIMVGIAFGRSRDHQRIGDVLVSERIIAYEPQRVGPVASVPRGPHFHPGVRLFDRFRNADTDWAFRGPTGVACSLHFGPILSGEKLIDAPAFKASLFETYPNAIGGDMEGYALAATADREKCEWILAKGICDWADGEKSDLHQGFAAAAAVSYVRHVLSQANVF